MIYLDILKYGKRHAVTVSYDDGNVRDRRLVEILNAYGIRGTFHLNSSAYQRADAPIRAEELADLYKNHEVAIHGVRHLSPEYLTTTGLINEFYEDKKFLEGAVGYPIRGASYANGSFNEETVNTLRTIGIAYSRTTLNTGNFHFPEHPLTWHPTCHQRDCLAFADKFNEAVKGYYSGPKLLYVWGHSHEFDRNMEWQTIEEFCRRVSGNDAYWYATNIEIYDYMTAQRSLVISADQTMVYNPSCMEVWFSSDGKICSVAPGALWKKA